MNLEPDDGSFPDPEYGVFGDINEQEPVESYKAYQEKLHRARHHKQRLARDREVSRAFNSHMIELYNNR